MKKILTSLCLVAGLGSLQATAEASALWKLSASESKVAYGSIKKNSVGEVNHFKTVSGHINKKGNINIDIDLTSVETFVEIRNTRMVRHVFDANASIAKLQASIDLKDIEDLPLGKTTSIDALGNITLSGKAVEIETSMFIARLTQNRFVATTDDIIMVKTEDLGVNEGVDMLMKLAKLDSITRVVPVSLRMVFERSANSSASAPTKAKQNSKKIAGNAKAGKKLYRQCLGCHQAKKPVNGIGPHLVNIVGRPAGSIDGFAYSKAMANSGITWSTETLKSFLANPQSAVPGNNMPFGGVSNPNDLNNLVAYLDSISK